MKPRSLRVYPNPYFFIDHEGRPAGTFDADPVAHNPDAKKIGIRRHAATVIEARSIALGDDRPSLHDLVHHYDEAVQVLPDGDGRLHGPSAHARMGILQGARILDVKDDKGIVIDRVLESPGALICADEETAKAVGIPFADPMEMLAAARQRAIADWIAHYGEPPAFAVEEEAEAHLPEAWRGVGLAKPAAEQVTAPQGPSARRAAAARTETIPAPEGRPDDHNRGGQ